MQDCWKPDPSSRPDFDQINRQLDVVLIHAAISDAAGRRFWQENFLKQEEVVLTPEEVASEQVSFLYSCCSHNSPLHHHHHLHHLHHHDAI